MIHVTAGILFHQERILLAQRKSNTSRPLQWELPGGKTLENESLEACLKRELFEEFSINATIGKRFMSHRHRYEDLEITLHAFFIDIFSGTFILHDHHKIAWIRIPEYANFPISEADLPILKKLLREFPGPFPPQHQ